MFKKLVLVLSLLSLLGWSCKEEQGTILAKVGKTTLTEEKFYAMIPSQYIGTLAPNQKRELLRRWIDTEVLYQDALKQGVPKESEVEAKLHEIERELLANEVLERHLIQTGSVDESEVSQYFEQHKDDYNTERRIAQIVVPEESQAYDILAQIKQGTSFSKLAREYSLDPSAKNGGVMGWLRRGDIPNLPEFEDAMCTLDKIGDVSEPVQTVYGFHIIKLLGIRKTSQKVEYQDMRDNIRNLLTVTKQRQAVTSLVERLRSETTIEEYYELFD